MITIHDVEQGSDEWQRLRDKLYTGTGGENLLKYPEHVKVVDGVVSKYALTEITGFKGNFHTDRGHELEVEALELYVDITGHEVSRPGFITNSEFPGCGCSLDGFDETLDYVLEVKAFNEKKHRAMMKGDIPLKVLAQIHFNITIFDKPGGRLLLYNPDLDDPSLCLKIIDIPRNEKICNNYRRKLAL